MSTTVMLGTNEFVGCVNILSMGDKPLLAVDGSPLLVTLHTPEEWPVANRVRVTKNELVPGQQHIAVVRAERSISILFQGFPVLIAIQDDEGKVLLRLDLRPLSINIFDDVSGLHVGGTSLERNRIVGAKNAIALDRS